MTQGCDIALRLTCVVLKSKIEKFKAGIATRDELRERAVQIAPGERRRSPDEPKIWFAPLESQARVLSDSNRRPPSWRR